MHHSKRAAFFVALALSCVNARANVLINGSFENPLMLPNSINQLAPNAVPGWQTTDVSFEIWGTGFNGVPSFDGNQFIELNAFNPAVVSQEVSGISPGSPIGFGFAHRGRAGLDTMNLTLTDLGGNNVLGGGDDTVLFTKDYIDGTNAWGVYDQTTEPPIAALGNTIRWAATSIAAAGGNPAVGNFLDAASLSVIPEPSSLLLAGAASLGLLRRRHPAR